MNATSNRIVVTTRTTRGTVTVTATDWATGTQAIATRTPLGAWTVAIPGRDPFALPCPADPVYVAEHLRGALATAV